MSRHTLYAALAFLLSTAVTLAALEGLVRVKFDDGMQFDLEMWKYARDLKQLSADPLIGHEHRPNRHAHLMGVDIDTNARGLRGPQLSSTPAAGVTRVLLLGDSFTLGWGVAYQATVAARLQALFAESGRSVEVINAGVGNYNTVQEVEAFLTKQTDLQPHVIVLNGTFNDAEPVPTYHEPILVRHSELLVLAAGRFDLALREASRRPDWRRYYSALFEGAGWEAAKGALARVAAWCRDHACRLLIVAWPDLHELKPYALPQITNAFREAAHEQHVAFVDLLGALEDQEPRTLWVSPGDAHPNATANGLIARDLLPHLTAVMDQSR